MRRTKLAFAVAVAAAFVDISSAEAVEWSWVRVSAFGTVKPKAWEIDEGLATLERDESRFHAELFDKQFPKLQRFAIKGAISKSGNVIATVVQFGTDADPETFSGKYKIVRDLGNSWEIDRMYLVGQSGEYIGLVNITHVQPHE